MQWLRWNKMSTFYCLVKDSKCNWPLLLLLAACGEGELQ